MYTRVKTPLTDEQKAANARLREVLSRPLYEPSGEVYGTEPVPGACCELARRRSCVCVESTSCPVHGVHCRGSHE